MKTAGYDITLLINENFLNQLSGSFFYSGFLTTNGSVDLYNGKINMMVEEISERKKISFDLDNSFAVKNSDNELDEEKKQFMKFDFRFKLTREPLIDFFEYPSGDAALRFSVGLRIYFWMWQGIEIKFDTELVLSIALKMDSDLNLLLDFSTVNIEEFCLKGNGNLKPDMQQDFAYIVEKIIKSYFSEKIFTKRLVIPCLSKNIPNVFPDSVDKSEELSISVDAMKVHSPTSLVLGINVNYQGGNPEELHEFVKNCSLGMAISSDGIKKIFSYFWKNACFENIGNWYKDKTILTGDVSGVAHLTKLDTIIKNITKWLEFSEAVTTMVLSGGFYKSCLSYKQLDCSFNVKPTFKIASEPKLNFANGEVYISNLDIDIYLNFSLSCKVELQQTFNALSYISELTGLCQKKETYEIDIPIIKSVSVFAQSVKVRKAKAEVVWDEAVENPETTLKLKMKQLNLYWDFINSKCPLANFPEKVLNWIIDVFEGNIVDAIPEFSVAPNFSFNTELVPWKLEVKGKRVEIGDSETVVAIESGFNVFKKDSGPVPRYIVNINTNEVHKIGCDCLLDTYEEHQRGYHLLQEALNCGFDGCQKCLPAFHHR